MDDRSERDRYDPKVRQSAYGLEAFQMSLHTHQSILSSYTRGQHCYKPSSRHPTEHLPRDTTRSSATSQSRFHPTNSQDQLWPTSLHLSTDILIQPLLRRACVRQGSGERDAGGGFTRSALLCFFDFVFAGLSSPRIGFAATLGSSTDQRKGIGGSSAGWNLVASC